MSWSPERVELLNKLWTDGMSATQIAGELGGITRNAVIGKLHRLGKSLSAGLSPTMLAQPNKPGRPRVRKPKERRQRIRKRPGSATIEEDRQAQARFEAAQARMEPEPETIESIIPVRQRCTLLELTEGSCRFPVGDPQDHESFYFCGASPLTGLPYCGHHARMRFRTPGEN